MIGLSVVKSTSRKIVIVPCSRIRNSGYIVVDQRCAAPRSTLPRSLQNRIFVGRKRKHPGSVGISNANQNDVETMILLFSSSRGNSPKTFLSLMLARVATELRSFCFSVIIVIVVRLIDKGSSKHVIFQRQLPVPFGFGRRLIGYRGRQKYFVGEIQAKYHDRDATVTGGAIGRVRKISGLISMRSRHWDKAREPSQYIFPAM